MPNFVCKRNGCDPQYDNPVGKKSHYAFEIATFREDAIPDRERRRFQRDMGSVLDTRPNNTIAQLRKILLSMRMAHRQHVRDALGNGVRQAALELAEA